MLSSNSSCNYNPFTANQPPINPSSENDISSDINNSSRSLQQEDNPFSSTFLYNFPTSPHTHLEYEDVYRQFLDLFSQNQSLTTTLPADNPNPPNEAEDFGTGKPTTTAVRKKRCGGSKKDRHSKIETARGPRDRRMRLSLDVARKFFGLQDLLGFDKASRTVDWLMKNSRSAIKELGGEGRRSSNSSASSTNNSNGGGQAATTSSNYSTTVRRASEETHHEPINSKQKRVKKMKGVATVRATVGRESRTKARERARERTSQKRRLVCTERKIFAESVLVRGLEKSHPIYDMEQTRVNLGTNYSHFNDSAAVFSHQHQQIAELQLCGKPWETNYSSFNLPG